MTTLVIKETYIGRVHGSELCGITFIRCTFQNTILPPIRNYKFFDCVFTTSEIGQSGGRLLKDRIYLKNKGFEDIHLEFSGNTFLKCKFENISVRHMLVRNNFFLNCEFKQFGLLHCKFSGSMRVSGCANSASIKILEGAMYEKSYNEIFYNNESGRPLLQVTWSMIKFLAELPVPKVGFSLLTVVAVFIPAFNYVSEVIWLQIDPIIDFVQQRWVGEENGLTAPKIFVSQRFASSLLLLILLVTVSIAHKVLCPREIMQYTKEYWIRELGRSIVEYDSIDSKNWQCSTTIGVVYFLIISALFYLYIDSSFRYFVLR